jgi:hypothetical protein
MNTPRINVEALAIKAYQSTKVTDEQNSVQWEDADEPLKIYYRTIAGAIAQAMQDDFNQAFLRLAFFLNDHQHKSWRLKDEHVKVETPYQLHDLATRALTNYKNNEVLAVSNLKTFQEDVLVYLRSISLYAQSVGEAGTHREKDARLRGLISVIETAIGNVRGQRTNLISGSWSEHPDLFTSDYHIRHYTGQINELQHKLNQAYKQLKDNNLQPDWIETF